MNDFKRADRESYAYSENNPQPAPSPILAKYMADNNIDKQMSVEDAKKWFYALRDTLREKETVRARHGK